MLASAANSSEISAEDLLPVTYLLSAISNAFGNDTVNSEISEVRPQYKSVYHYTLYLEENLAKI